jgi:NADPH-dependent curcumin reductase CurA
VFQGLKDVGKLEKGETLVVSGAAGAVGSLACQLGKQAGAKVIAIAGSNEKCAWLEKELGVHKALNYKSETFYKEWKAEGYFDVFFDNVGGVSSVIPTSIHPLQRSLSEYS